MKNLLFAFGILAVSALSAFEIVEPAAKDGSLRLAVQELRHHLALVADDVPYRFVFAKPDDVKEVAPFESRYRVKDDTVWFWGDDGGKTAEWDWGDDRGKETQRRNGTLFAVELFGERELGLRYLWPGADGVAVTKPKTPILSLPRHAEGRHVSTLVKARIRSYAQYHPFPWEQVKAYMPRELYDAPRPTTHEERVLWQRRNRLQDREYFTYGHAFTHWKDRFEKSHPEYLNLHIDAKMGVETRGWTSTQGRDRTKHCVSNEAVVDQILADWCANGTNRFLNVCENDSGFWCECPACRALDVPKEGEKPLAHVTDRYVNFWNRIAKKARAIRPDVQLVTYVYSDYRLPPRREKIAYGENMLCGFVFAEAEDAMALINDWRKAGMRHFFFRPNYLHSIVTIHRGYERFFYNQFHELLNAGMIGVDYDANDNRPMTTLEFYVLARAFADPTATFESIVADYYAGYGAAAADVKAYFEAVRQTGEAALEECRRLARNPNSDFGGGGTLPRTEETGRNEAELQAKYDMLAASVARHAKSGDLTAVESARLQSLLLQAEHGILTYRFLTAVADRPVPEMKQAAEALNAFRIAHKDDLRDIYVQIYRLWWAEVRYWKLYRKRLQEPKGVDDVARLEAFIRIPSVSKDIPEVNRAVAFLKGEATKDGLHCWVEAMPDGRKVLYAANEQTKAPDVLISAHLDVVPAQTPDLFIPRRSEGRLYGRGASDCKEHCILAVRLMRELKGKVSVGCLFGSDEEIGGASTAFMLEKGYGGKRLAIILDSEQFAITTRQKGLAEYVVTAKEAAAHTGMMKGTPPNASLRLLRAYDDLVAALSDHEDGSWRDVINLSRICGTREEAEMALRVRCANYGSWERIEALIRDKTGCDIVCTRKGDPVILDESAPYLQEFRELMRRRWPTRQVDFYHLNSSTDARHIQKLGLPMLILGVDARGAHTPAEHLVLSSLDEHAELIDGYLLKRFGKK
ncbi:MAG: M20/M25/M40 family metallo-hydrolase [Kiritimatiellae bacterium]|nr:M20/M25/M40 family metallo-hydrolase [Kiritimatiellia bacterium]